MNPALAGVALAVVRRSRRRRVRPERTDARSSVWSSPWSARRSWPIRLPRRSAWPPASWRRSWPATCCGSPRRGPGVRTGGSLIGWPTEAFLATGAAVVGYGSHGLGRPGGRTRRSPRRPGSRWRRWPSCRSLNGRDILRIGDRPGPAARRARCSSGRAWAGRPTALERRPDGRPSSPTLGGAVAILAIAARSDGRPGFELSATTPAPLEPRRRRPPDRTAHEPDRLRRRHVRRPPALAIALRARRPWALGDRPGRPGRAPSSRRSPSTRPRRSSIGGERPGDDARICACSSSSARSSGSGSTIAGLAGGTRRDAPAVTLVILGSAALTLALVDPRLAVLAATTGGLFGVLVTLDSARRPRRRDGRHPRDAGGRRRRCAGDRRDGLDRARPQPAGCPAGRLRARLPGLRARGRDALRGDPVPPVGGAPDRRRARDGAAGPDRARAGIAGGRRPWPGSTRRSRRCWSTSTPER